MLWDMGCQAPGACLTPRLSPSPPPLLSCRPVSYNTQPGASGPWPHSRYVVRGGTTWTVNVTALVSDAGAALQASDTLGIINDDLVGGVTQGGNFCLDLVRVRAPSAPGVCRECPCGLFAVGVVP